MLDIILWDENALRLQEINANLSMALTATGKKAKVICNSEPPLLSRMGLIGRTPLVEINGFYWEYGHNPKTITVDQLVLLLKKH